MLVLTRKKDQSLTLDGPAVITVNRIGGGKVAIGITAPDSTKVLRAELVEHPQPNEDTDASRV